MAKYNPQRLEPIYDYVYYNQQILKYEQAQIGLASTSLQYGFNVFCGIRGYHIKNNNYIFRLEDHFNRFMDANKIMNFGVKITFEEFKDIIFALVKKNNISEDFYIRAFIFTPNSYLAPTQHDNVYQISVYMQKLPAIFKHSNGKKLQISSFVKYSDNSISTKAKVGGSYVNSLMANSHAKMCGFDDALMINENGFICECSTSNIIVVKNNKVMTPSFSDGPLGGITLRSAIEILNYNHIDVEEISVTRSLAYTVDEMITTGSALGIQNVDCVDHCVLPSNKDQIFKLLDSEFSKVFSNKHELSIKWMLKVV